MTGELQPRKGLAETFTKKNLNFDRQDAGPTPGRGHYLRTDMTKFEQHMERIKKICADLRVRRLDLAGSAARDDFQPERSDIDVLVEFEGVDRLFHRYFELKERLEQELARQVDVIQDSAVKNPYLRQSLDRDRIPLYES